jgi:hypothetical protein
MSFRLEPVHPIDPIAVIRRLTESERELESLRFDAVKRARGAGRSWEDIAAALGVSRQSAWQYYAPRILKEFSQEENTQPGISSESAMDIAVSEAREVRRRRRRTRSV